MTGRGGAAAWSVVTVTHDSAAQLRSCWAEADIGAAEWVVVDNASTDDSVAVARELGARVIELPENIGFGAANNVALRALRRPWVLFANPDVRIDSPGGLRRLAAVSEANGALVAPQLLNPDGSEQPNARGLPYLASKLAHRSVRLTGFRPTAYARTGLPGPTYAAWVIGAAVAGPRAHFEALGGWDERYFVYYEDHDLGLRAWARGIPVVVVPEVRWTHLWQRATTRADLRAWRHELRSALLFYSRYPRLGVRLGRFAEWERRVWTPARPGVPG